MNPPLHPGTSNTYYQLFESLPDAVFVHRPDGPFLAVNRAACQRLGYSREELVHLAPTDIDSPRFAEAFETRATQTRVEGEFRFETEHVTRDGRIIPTEINARIIDFQGEEAILVVARDISDQKTLERALEEKASALTERVKELHCLYGVSELIENADADLEGTLQGCVDLIPPSWLHPEVCCARLTLDEACFVSPGFETSPWCLSRPITVGGQTIGNLEVFYTRDMPHQDEGPFLAEEVDLLQAIATRLGRTLERLRAEEALAKTHNNLEARVAERTAALRNMNQRLLLEIGQHRKTAEQLSIISRAVDQAHDGLAVTDTGGNLIFINRAFAEMHGYTPDEVKDRNLSIFHTDDQMDAVRRANQQTFETGSFFGEVWHKRKDGSTFPSLMNNSLLKDDFGQVVGLVGTMRDITELKRSEQALKQREADLRAFLDAIPESALLLDTHGRVLLANPQVAQRLGVSVDDLVGQNAFDFVDSDVSSHRHGMLKEALESGKPVRFEDRRGHSIIDNYICPVRDEAGETRRVAVLGFDVTEKRQLEHQLIQKEKLASLGFLISGIAHEINNPNNFITFNVPILRDYINTLIPLLQVDSIAESRQEWFGMTFDEFLEDLTKILDHIEHGTHRINTIVSNLRNFSRKKDSITIQRTEIQDIVKRAVGISRGKISRMVKTLEQDVELQLCATTDPEVIETVLINLLINAAQAADKEDSYIRIQASRPSDPPHHIRLSVSDNGCGMDSQTLEHIFDPFFTTKPPGEGTGLGLSLCHNLISTLGGRFEVESTPGQGSCFTLLIPDSSMNPLAG